MNLADLVQLAELHQRKHEQALLEMLKHLQKIDLEVADRTVDVFGDKAKAARWLANPVRSLGSVPLQLLAQGRRQDVLKVLLQILHGTYA